MNLRNYSTLFYRLLLLPPIIGWSVFAYFAPQYVQQIASGEYVPYITDWIVAHPQYSFAQDWQKLCVFLFGLTVLYELLVIFAYHCFRNLSKIRQVFREELFARPAPFDLTVRTGVSRHTKWIIAILLVLVFWFTYARVGMAISTIPCYSQEENIFFGADHLEPIQEWHAFRGEHDHKGSHPLVLLLGIPPTTLCYWLTGDEIIAAVMVNAMFAAIAVGFCFLLLASVLAGWIDALLIAVVFGFSMSQLFFGALPETYALASIGIVGTWGLFWLSISRQRLYLGGWVLIGLLSFAVLITNVVQTALCLGFVVWKLREKRGRLPVFLSWVVAILVLAVPLNVIQKLLMPNSAFFFLPGTLTTEIQYVHAAAIMSPLAAVEEMLKHFFLHNVIGFLPAVAPPDAGALCPELTYFQQLPHFGILQMVSVVLWGAVIVTAVNYWRKQESRDMLLIVGAALLFEMGLHSLYGWNELFLYTCDYTFPVIAVMLVRVGEKRLRYRLLLLGFGAVIAVSNLLLILSFRGIFG